MKKLCNDFQEENETDQNPIENFKSVSRLIKEVEKARITLSGDTEANLSVDYFFEEEDFETELSRD